MSYADEVKYREEIKKLKADLISYRETMEFWKGVANDYQRKIETLRDEYSKIPLASTDKKEKDD